MQVRSPLKWVGGKFHSAQRILAEFPHHQHYTTYCEPCGGAAHVLMQKPQWGHKEVYNDLNDDLCNFWQQIHEHADELQRKLQALPYSRKFYYDYHERLFNGCDIDAEERAVLWFYVLRGTATGWLRESPGGWNNAEGNAVSFRSMTELFKQVQERFTHPRVLIDNRDVERVIEEYDSPDTLFYIGAEYYYQAGMRTHEKKVFDHKRLAEILNQVRGKVALSYYPAPELEVWYSLDTWRRVTWQQMKISNIKRAEMSGEASLATEMLLCIF